MPVESIVLIEASVFGGDEGVSHELRHHRDRNVHSADVFEVTEELRVAVIYIAAFGWMEGADFCGSWAAVKPTGAKPSVERDDAGAGDNEQAEPRPMTAEPFFRGVRRIWTETFPEDRSSSAEESCDHAVLVVKQRAASR